MAPTDSQGYLTQKLIIGGITLAVLLLAMVAFTLPHVEPDLWGHVQYGRDFWANGLPQTTTYSFTAEGHPWINHENLSELTFAAIVDRWGISALALFRTLLGMVIAGVLAWRAGRSIESSASSATFCWPVAGFTLAILSLALTSYWQIRPQVFSCTLFAALVLMLGRHDQSLKRDAWFIPLLLVVWANTHGAFLAGVCVFAAYFVFRSIEALVRDRQTGTRTAMQMGGLVAVGCLATLANPYGWKLHQWLLQSLTIPRPEIVEWHPMSWSSEPFLPFAALMGLCVAGLAFSKRKWDWTQIALIGIVWWQALSHQRHVPFFAILTCAWMPEHWQSVWNRFTAWRATNVEDNAPIAVQYAMVGCLAVLNVFLAVFVASRLGAVDVDRAEYPVSAMQYIADQQLSGNMVVTYNWAQYAIGCFGPDQAQVPKIRVGFDGRFRTCYPLDLIDQHFDFILGNHPRMPRHRDAGSPPPEPAAVLERGRPDLVLISRHQPNSTAVMERARDTWSLLYQDELAQLWGRKTAFDRLVTDRTDRQALLSPAVTDTPQSGVVPWPALPIHEKYPVVSSKSTAGELLTWSPHE